MQGTIQHLEGKKFCVVFVKVLDETAGDVRLHCLHGRASVDGGRLSCVRDNGVSFQVPGSAIGNILPSDGTALLKDAEYFVLVRTDPGVEFNPPDDMDIDVD